MKDDPFHVDKQPSIKPLPAFAVMDLEPRELSGGCALGGNPWRRSYGEQFGMDDLCQHFEAVNDSRPRTTAISAAVDRVYLAARHCR